MNQTEVWIMVLSKEREINLKRHLEEGRVLRELGKKPVGPKRSGHAGVLKLAWHVANGVLRSRWILSGLRGGEGEPRVTAADELIMEVPGGR